MIAAQAVAVTYQEVPIKRIERAGVICGAFAHLVGAATTIIGHALDVLAARTVRLGPHVAAVCMHDHTKCVGQLHPVERVHVDGQVPLTYLTRRDTCEQGEITGHHEPLYVVGVGMLEALVDRLRDHAEITFAPEG